MFRHETHALIELIWEIECMCSINYVSMLSEIDSPMQNSVVSNEQCTVRFISIGKN